MYAAATQRSDDSFALFKVWEGVKEVHYVGKVLYFFEPLYSPEIYAYVRWLGKPKSVNFFYSIRNLEQTSESFIATSAIINSVFLLDDTFQKEIYAVPKHLECL